MNSGRTKVIRQFLNGVHESACFHAGFRSKF